MVVDGHDVEALSRAFHEASVTKGKPTCIVAKTFKGKGIPGNCRMASEAAVHISYTGVSNCLTVLQSDHSASCICNRNALQHLTSYDKFCMSSFVQDSLLFIILFYGNGILGKLTKHFGCRSAPVTICCYTSWIKSSSNTVAGRVVSEWRCYHMHSHWGMAWILLALSLESTPDDLNNMVQTISLFGQSRHCKWELFWLDDFFLCARFWATVILVMLWQMPYAQHWWSSTQIEQQFMVESGKISKS